MRPMAVLLQHLPAFSMGCLGMGSCWQQARLVFQTLPERVGGGASCAAGRQQAGPARTCCAAWRAEAVGIGGCWRASKVCVADTGCASCSTRPGCCRCVLPGGGFLYSTMRSGGGGPAAGSSSSSSPADTANEFDQAATHGSASWAADRLLQVRATRPVVLQR